MALWVTRSEAAATELWELARRSLYFSPCSLVTGRGREGEQEQENIHGSLKEGSHHFREPWAPRSHLPCTTPSISRGRQRQRSSQRGRERGMEGKIAEWERGPDRAGVGA